MADRNKFILEVTPAAGIAGGAAGRALSVTIDDAYFVVEEIVTQGLLTASYASGPVGASLPVVSLTAAGASQLPGLGCVTAGLKIGRDNWTDQEVPLTSYGPTPNDNGVLSTPLVIPPKTTIDCTFTNTAPGVITIKPSIILKGYKTRNPVQ